jgi:hypothetical protein
MILIGCCDYDKTILPSCTRGLWRLHAIGRKQKAPGQNERFTAQCLAAKECSQPVNQNYNFSNNGESMEVERGYFFPNRIRALASFIKCRYCGGEVVQVSAKAKGCYGCCNAKKETCENTLLISVRGVEAIILNDLKEKFLTTQSLECADKPALEAEYGMTESEPKPEKPPSAHAQPTEISSYYVSHTSIQTVALLDEAWFKRPLWDKNTQPQEINISIGTKK